MSSRRSITYRLPPSSRARLAGIDSIGSWDFHQKIGYLAEVALPISFSAAALCLAAVLFSFRRFRAIEWIVVGMLGLLALFLHRPLWLQRLILLVPFYRSLRWPMRETFLFLFFAHLLVGLAWPYLKSQVARFLPALSAAAFFIPLFLSASPTLNRFPVDRLLLVNGTADRVWREVGELLPESKACLVVPLLAQNVKDWPSRLFIAQAPHTLLGAYSYPVLFGMKSSTGYAMPGYEQKFRGQSPMLGPGYFAPDGFTEGDMKDPHLLFTRLASLDPVDR